MTYQGFLSNCIEGQYLESYSIIEPVCKFTNPQNVKSANPHIIINTLYGTLLIVTVHLLCSRYVRHIHCLCP